MTLAQALKKAPLFAGMNDETTLFFVNHSHTKHYEKDSPLFTMGDPAHAFFFIIAGWVKLYRVNRDGAEAVINVFAPGETFAEAAVFGPHQRYPVNAQAVDETQVLEIPRGLFVDKIKEDSSFALSILGSISARQRYLIQQIEQLSVKEAPQRLGTFLLRLCPAEKSKGVEIDLPYDKSLIARRLNIQPETFSRALKKLEPHGVGLEGKNIVIQDADQLARFCDIDDRSALI
jgi:CRP-like cAMP-binding protein